MRSYATLFVLLFVVPLTILAQQKVKNEPDITGLWTGTLYNDSTKTYSNYEVAITKDKEKFTGFSHTWFVVSGKQYYGVKKVSIKQAADGKIIIVDADLVANDYPDERTYVPQLNVLTLNVTDTAMFLTGPFVTNRTKTYRPVTGSVKLRRNTVLWQSALWPHLQQLGKEKDFSFLTPAR